MLIQEEYICKNGVVLIHTYSDTGSIRQIETGIIYDEAYDIPNTYTYEEVEDNGENGNAN